ALLWAAPEAFPAERTLPSRSGLASRAAGRPADAVAAFERLVAAHPDDAEAVLMLADALEAAGDPARAAEVRAGRPADSPGERLRRAALRYAQAETDPNAAEEARQLPEPFAEGPAPATAALLTRGPPLFETPAYDRAPDAPR